MSPRSAGRETKVLTLIRCCIEFCDSHMGEISISLDGISVDLGRTGKKKKKKVREKSRGFHNHKPQPFPDPKRKPTNPNKHKSNKRTKSTKISSLFPKR